MEKNFRVRLICGLIIFIIALIGLYTFGSAPLRVAYALFAIVAGIELFSFFKKKVTIPAVILAIFEIVFLIMSSIFVAKVGVIEVWYIILGVCGYDIFAYLCGKAIGGKVFKKSRPFPHISMNKTWEGTILGLVVSVGLVALLMFSLGRTDYVFLLSGPLALIGDLYESLMKRKFKIKDSNEILIKKNKFFTNLELLVGGSEGHGGFLDRIDSTAFAASVFLIIFLII